MGVVINADEGLAGHRAASRCNASYFLVIVVIVLANVNSRSRSLYVIVRSRDASVRLSVVCNVRAPYSGD